MKVSSLLLVIACMTNVSVDAKGNTKAKREKNAKRRRERELQTRIDQHKASLKSNRCNDMEDELLLFNCLYYNLSPKCFINNFGEHGLEIGEVLDDKVSNDFNTCWEKQVDDYERGI